MKIYHKFLLYQNKLLKPYIRIVLGLLEALTYLASLTLIIGVIYEHGFPLSVDEVAKIQTLYKAVWIIFLIDVTLHILLEYRSTKKQYRRLAWILSVLLYLTLIPVIFHAGGLRYHGAGVIVSQLLKDNLMEAVDIQQLESFEAGCLFAQSEGIIPAPESSHAIAAAIREANKCKETGEEKVILFNLSGHGLIDMASYDKYLAGDLVNYSLTDEDIQKNLDEIGDLAK